MTADTFDPERWNLVDGVLGQLREGWGVGRYDEGRLALVGDGGVSTGVEVFAPEGTEVRAPAAGSLSRLDATSLALSLDDTWRLVLGGLERVTDAIQASAGDLLGVVGRRPRQHPPSLFNWWLTPSSDLR